MPREPPKALEQRDVVVVEKRGQYEHVARKSYCFCYTCAYGI